MTLIRVNPESVRSYGGQAQAKFDAMQAALVKMVNDVVAVRYYGPNAVAFKTQCGEIAADFANKLHLDLNAMATAVSTSTSNIAASLGGTAITIQVDPKPIVAPQPEVVDYVDVDTNALDAEIPQVTAKFGELRDSLTSNLESLRATDWEGNAKTMAVDAVSGFTTAAVGKCNEAETSLTTFIRNQVDSVVAADH